MAETNRDTVSADQRDSPPPPRYEAEEIIAGKQSDAPRPFDRQDAPHATGNTDNDDDDDDDDDDDSNDGVDGVDGAKKKKKPNLIAKTFAKLGLDVPTLVTMLKGSLPPAISIAMCQAPAVSAYFSTLGYLVAIISVLALAILPRGKFLMSTFLSVIGVCIGSAMAMLMLWSAIRARENTTPPGSLKLYNASQSAVCGVWLFFNIWISNMLRAKFAAFNIPVIIYSILSNIAATFGPFMRTTAAAEAFVKQLFTAMLSGFAIALGVNLFVVSVSSRLVVFKEFEGAIGLLRRTVSLQRAYLVSIESADMFAAVTRTQTILEREAKSKDGGKKKPKLTKEARAAKALAETTAKMRELAGKLHADLPFAKRDFAWGKLDAGDLSEMFRLVRDVYIPILGMTTIIDIFKRVSERRNWNLGEDATEELIAEKEAEKHVWNQVMKQMHEPFEILSEAIDQGLEHAGLCLELIPRPKKLSMKAKAAKDAAQADVEAQDQGTKPGEPGFSNVIAEKVEAFCSRKGELLRTWVEERRLADEEENRDRPTCKCASERRERDQAQLYIVLYMETLMHASGDAVQNLVAFADKKVADGTMSRKRLILPTLHRLRKWFSGIFSNEDSSAEQSPDIMESAATIVFFGDGYNQKKDPEHLPPATPWQHFGNVLRKVPKFFSSEESIFGFRVACATMTIGIVAFLESTQIFFMEQRLVWAMIMIAIGMTMTSGQSFFGFLCRVGGTVIAMVLSFIIWYIVDEKTPGVIVFLWFFEFLTLYFLIKFPRFIPAAMITMVTVVLIIGYELQVLSIGQAAAERTGQPVYPIFQLAPYRLACVAGGSLVAFFWTIFPSPLTDRTWLRRDMAATLYLIANYFGVVSSTLQSRVHGTAGDASIAGTPAHHLLKVGRKIFGKVMMLVPSMLQHSEWQKYEPTIGGKFPREAYDDIILRSTRIMGYLTLMSYTLMHPDLGRPNDTSEDEKNAPGQEGPTRSRQPSIKASSASIASATDRAWLDALGKVLIALEPARHAILSTLTLLSHSLMSGNSLPPFLPLPRPYEMTRRMIGLGDEAASSESDADVGDSFTHPTCTNPGGCKNLTAAARLLSPRNMEQPGYAEFAVLQVCNTLVCDDLEGLMKSVGGLVGVVDFSFRIGEQDSSLSSSGASSLVGGGKGKGKVD
ncbi:hypothetical protein B0H63DRAFT_452637 [Podospora didyma]|uniref:ER transporter 6TM N-terminal domain-containing protein n=1 Tax=Podospora didyma TaxID=330526 RepID=A0AAE0N9V8_9PEZI|nr:hypothetical protein B0H63DRAFT_452637 [Podospora didyma]